MIGEQPLRDRVKALLARRQEEECEAQRQANVRLALRSEQMRARQAEELDAQRRSDALLAETRAATDAERRAAQRLERRLTRVDPPSSPDEPRGEASSSVWDEERSARQHAEARIERLREATLAQRRAAERLQRRLAHVEPPSLPEKPDTSEAVPRVDAPEQQVRARRPAEELSTRLDAEARIVRLREAALVERRAAVRSQRRRASPDPTKPKPSPRKKEAPAQRARSPRIVPEAPAAPKASRTPSKPAAPAASAKAPQTGAAPPSGITAARRATKPGRVGELSRLQTNGAFVVDENGFAVSFRGLTVNGVDALSDTAIATIAKLWRVNVVRLPIAPATIVSVAESADAQGFFASLDDLIGRLAKRGIYALLSMQPPSTPDVTSSAIDSDIFFAWQIVAQRYLRAASVLFEVLSTPMPASGDWLQAMQILIGWIRTVDPSALLFVGNGTAAPNVSALPILFSTGDPAPNIVYTIRIGQGQQVPTEESAGLTTLASSYPVVATYWESFSTSAMDRSSELTAQALSRLGIGWIAAGWDSEPPLVVNAAGDDFTPTKWGLVVRRAATLPTKAQLAPALPG